MELPSALASPGSFDWLDWLIFATVSLAVIFLVLFVFRRFISGATRVFRAANRGKGESEKAK